MIKKGFPFVLVRINSANGDAVSRVQLKLSAINCATSDNFKADKEISDKFTSASRSRSIVNLKGCPPLTLLSRYAPIKNKYSISSSVIINCISCKDALSAHCKSSRKITKGCSCLANTLTNLTKTKLKRFWAFVGVRRAAGGCLPIIASISGIKSIITWPLSFKASNNRSFQ